MLASTRGPRVTTRGTRPGQGRRTCGDQEALHPMTVATWSSASQRTRAARAPQPRRDQLRSSAQCPHSRFRYQLFSTYKYLFPTGLVIAVANETRREHIHSGRRARAARAQGPAWCLRSRALAASFGRESLPRRKASPTRRRTKEDGRP